MSLKSELKWQLTMARGFAESIIAEFETPEDWTHRAHPRANHALWCLGHIALSDNMWIRAVDPSRRSMPEGFDKLFGMGSQPSDNPDDYPPVAEVVDYWRDRRRVLLELLEGLSDDDLAKPLPQGMPEFLTDYASAFMMAAWHEGLHLGQVTVAHRSLGREPMAGRPKRAEAEAHA